MRMTVHLVMLLFSYTKVNVLRNAHQDFSETKLPENVKNAHQNVKNVLLDINVPNAQTVHS
jgi:hypothetical protein